MRNPWSTYWAKIKTRRDEWRPVLESELEKWSLLSPEQVISRLNQIGDCYEVEFQSKKYQVEVAILENTDKYLHVGISVDDGTLPASLRPVSSSIVCEKTVKRRSDPL